jgi:hypothetical protein
MEPSSPVFALGGVCEALDDWIRRLDAHTRGHQPLTQHEMTDLVRDLGALMNAVREIAHAVAA